MYSLGTKNDDFGHAQVLRDLEELFIKVSQSTGNGVGANTDQDNLDVSQENEDDGAQGEPLWTAIRRLSRDLSMLEAANTLSNRLLIMDQGNAIHTTLATVYGLKANGSITSVPSAAPSFGATNTYTDGLACAEDQETGLPVWVSTGVSIGGDLFRDANIAIADGHAFIALRAIQVPISGGGGATAPVYLPFSLA